MGLKTTHTEETRLTYFHWCFTRRNQNIALVPAVQETMYVWTDVSARSQPNQIWGETLRIAYGVGKHLSNKKKGRKMLITFVRDLSMPVFHSV